MNTLRIGIVTFTVALASSLPTHAKTTAKVEVTPRNSTFGAELVKRNPFLPIGWRKKSPVREPTRQITITPDVLRVTSIVSGGVGAGLAIVNGRDYAAGEAISLDVQGHEVGVLVKEVRDGEVVFSHNGRDIRVSLVKE